MQGKGQSQQIPRQAGEGKHGFETRQSIGCGKELGSGHVTGDLFPSVCQDGHMERRKGNTQGD
eukprot:scaffold4003_cov165-Amphora_coffeaeformis.AAC.3